MLTLGRWCPQSYFTISRFF